MTPVYYDRADLYITSKCDARSKIAAIDQIINALFAQALKVASGQNAMFSEYDVDTGQTKIKCNYRSPKELMDSIEAFKQLKEIYKNDINGHVFRLVDAENFIPRFPNGTR